jgi:hypothetical protein
MVELPNSKVMRVIRSQYLVGLRVVKHACRPNNFDAWIVVTARNCDTWVRNCFIGLYLLKFVVVVSVIVTPFLIHCLIIRNLIFAEFKFALLI